MTCAIESYLGAYVLCALEPDETERVEAHLAGCADCRDEVASLETAAARLWVLSPDDVESLDPPATSRRRIRYKVMIPVAAAAAACAVLVGVAGSGGHSTSAREVRAVDPQTRVSATLNMWPRSWGTELRLTLAGAYPGGSCSLIAHSRTGQSDIAATWVASPQGTANVPGATSIPTGQLSELDVVTGTGIHLVRISPSNSTQ